MKTFLIIGIDAVSIDFSGPNTSPAMTAEKLLAEIEETRQQFAAQGDRADVCAVKLDASAAARVSDQLARSTYDCIMIGGGLRQDAAIEVLEWIIDAVHRHAPAAAIAFLKMPKDGIAAAGRVLSRDFTQAGLLIPSPVDQNLSQLATSQAERKADRRICRLTGSNQRDLVLGQHRQRSSSQSAKKSAMATATHADRVGHVRSLIKAGDAVFDRQDVAAMDAARHPDIITHMTGAAQPTVGRAALATALAGMFRAFPNVHVDNYPNLINSAMATSPSYSRECSEVTLSPVFSIRCPKYGCGKICHSLNAGKSCPTGTWRRTPALRA